MHITVVVYVYCRTMLIVRH